MGVQTAIDLTVKLRKWAFENDSKANELYLVRQKEKRLQARARAKKLIAERMNKSVNLAIPRNADETRKAEN